MLGAEDAVNPMIVFITSASTELVSIDRAQYCVSKAALSMTARLFAARLAPHGIAVHEVRPGFIQTDMTASAGSATIDQWIADGRVPMPRWGKPEDMAGAALFLASPLAGWVTGTTLHVDGGALAAAGWYRDPQGTWTNVPVISGNGFNF